MSSSRLAIAQGLVGILTGVTNPLTSQPLYQAVQLGGFFNPEVYTSWAEVAFVRGKSGPSGSGGSVVGWRIRDTVTLSIVSGWDYEEDSTAAMTNMLEAMDILLPILHSHVVIPSQGNPAVPVGSVWLQLEDDPDIAMPVRIPNGHIFLLWHVFVSVRQEYNIQQLNP